MLRPAATLTTLVLLATTTAAHAYPARQLQTAAYTFWGWQARAACPDGITTTKGAPADDLPAETAGWASAGDCTVHLSVYRPFAGRWPADCATYLHEVGHIIGHDHDYTGYGNIMRAESTIAYASGTVGPRHRHVEAWSGIGTYWCQHYQRPHR